MRHLRSRLTFALLLLAPLALAATARGEGELPFQYGVTGSTPAEDGRNPTYMLGFGEVQELLFELAIAPQPRARIEAAVSSLDFTLEEMVTAGLLAPSDDGYRIAFNLLLVEDQQAILELAEVRGVELAEAFLARRDDFESIAAGYDPGGELTAELLFGVLGCFSLDWDGLALTRELGYRAGPQRVMEDASYTPWAKERGADVSLEGLYWGSHNQTVDGVTFTSFGDHHSLPRFALPDMLWNSRGAFSRYADLEAQRVGGRLLSAYFGEIMADAAAIMLRLRHQSLSMEALAEETGIEQQRLEPLLDLLDFAEMVGESDGEYRARAIVLVEEDRETVTELLALGRQVMVDWHEANYADIRRQLASLTPTRQGVDFEVVYTSIWHFVFGVANRTLVERGLFADPYAAGRRHKGFLPVVWREGLTPGI